MNRIIHGPNVSGQSLADRVMAAKHTITGQDLVKAVFKATTDEVMGPKRKHLDHLIWCTNISNASIPELVKHLLERTQATSWVVVLKALLAIHDIINYGNEEFTRYLSGNQRVFNLGSFTDRADRIGLEMSSYVRCYAKYLNEKLCAFRVMSYDFCKVKRGKEDGFLRKIHAEQLLKTLPVLQTQLDVLLEFEVSTDELTNGVISFCFMAMFQDMIRLFACYNDGIINLLEKFFDMNQQQCKDALEIYKKFIARMERVRAFLRVAEMIGVNKNDIPNLAEVPDGLYEALEDHMKSFGIPNKHEDATSRRTRPSAGITSAISKFSAAAQLGSAPGAGSGALSISDNERQRILEEEQRQLDILKKQRERDGNRKAELPAASVKPQPQTPTTSATPLSRTQSVPAPADTSRWTRVDDVGMDTKPVSTPPGFTGFGDMLKPTKSPTAIETERKTQSQLLARSMSVQPEWSPHTTMSAVSPATGAASPVVMSGMQPTYVVPTLQLYSPTPLPYTGPQWGQPGMMMMPAAPWQATATSPQMMRQQTPNYPSGAM